MCSRTTILMFTVILLLSVVACQKAKKAGGSKDLLLASMQNTIADLTGVVGQQTKAISEVMIWLSEAKVEFMKLQNSMDDNNKMLIANSTKERAELSTKFFEQLAVLNNKLTDSDNNTTAKLVELRDEAAKMEDLASNVNELKNNITTELDEVKTTISNIGSEVEIVSSEEEGGNPKCAKVCTGTTGRTTTSWSASGSIAFTTVTIQGCGFVKVPTVTTSIEGSGYHYMVTGASAVRSVTTSSFTIWLKEDSDTASHARKYGWNVEWIAVGYTC